MKKTLLVSLSLLVVAALAVGMTLAYLQDEKSDANVMTMGNVTIEQIEQERNENGELVSFSQAKPAYPAVYETQAWDTNKLALNGGEYKMFAPEMKNVVDKIVTVKNTGNTAAYVRTVIAVEEPAGLSAPDILHLNMNMDGIELSNWQTIVIDGVTYSVVVCTYTEAVEAGEISAPSLLQVFLDPKTTNEDCAKFGETWDILVVSQAVQTSGFASAEAALTEAFGEVNADNHPWKGEGKLPVIPKLVDTAEELTEALKNGGEVILTKDLEVDGDSTVTIASGKEAVLNLNGKTITSVAEGTGNREIFNVRGNMEVKNGTITLEATVNQGWNAMATVFDVTAGGVLNLDGVNLNVSGTDMTFGVHLNNWGEATLNMNNCVIKTNYCAVRVFNSGYDMNNVSIHNSTLEVTGSSAFWVHNYTAEDFGASYDAAAVSARLNFDIYGNNNTFTSSNANAPIRYGMTNSIRYTADGTLYNG